MNDTKSLSEILNDNGWSGENGYLYTDKASTHNYIDGFYEAEFSRYKNENIRLLEVGIAGGFSLLLWNEYFHNNSGIYGVDVNSGVVTRELSNYSNIKPIFADAYTKEFADSLPNFDIMIDDGPHTLESMVSFINLYLPKLNENGVLVIEDIQSIAWMPVLKHTFEKIKTDKDECDVVDLRETKGRYDDLMFVVRRAK